MAKSKSNKGRSWRILEYPAERAPISKFVRSDLTAEQQKAVAAYFKKCRDHRKGPFWNS